MSIDRDCIEERETTKFEEGLKSKVKLSLYKTFVTSRRSLARSLVVS